jgi:hypothetical protein
MSARLATLAIAAALAFGLAACGKTEPKGPPQDGAQARWEQARARKMTAACSSRTTYERLKQIAFDEAIRRGSADPANLDTLSTHALARVENPLVEGRNDDLDITECSGRLILQLPPGAERAFGGKRQLAADIEYAGQAAADGSGLVYRMTGAEPIIGALAGFNLKASAYRPPATPVPHPTQVAAAPPAAAEPDRARAAPDTPVQSAPTQAQARPTPRPAPQPTGAAASAAPSFNCRYARSRAEQMVCRDAELAALDRRMSSQFYAELGRADARRRAALRQTRDRFLVTRERCADEACVAQAYRERMEEIAGIAADR